MIDHWAKLVWGQELQSVTPILVATVQTLATNDVTSAALVSGIFWPQFCTVGGSGDTVAIFIYDSSLTREAIPPRQKLRFMPQHN